MAICYFHILTRLREICNFTRGVGILIEEIINRYRKFILQHYKSQGEAAEDLNISRSHLNKIINRRDNPSLTLLLRMEQKMKDNNFI